MGNDEILKVVGAIVIIVLIIGLAIFMIGQTSKQANDLTGQNVADSSQQSGQMFGALSQQGQGAVPTLNN